MRRKLRTKEELREIYREFPELESLKNSLEKIDNVVIQPDGTGQCVFKVYPVGRMGPNEQLMRIYKPFDKSEIAWERLPEPIKSRWKDLWRPHVNSTEKPWGSKLKENTPADTILQIVEQFARDCFPLLSQGACDLVEPPQRIETLTNRIIRDTALAQTLKALHEYRCQICGFSIELPDGSRYAEAHHIKPLGTPHNGLDVEGNIIVLCPNHHAMCDLGAISLNLGSLRLLPDHQIDRLNIDYHNSAIYRGTDIPPCSG